MITRIGGILRDGPVRRILELAAAVRESEGALSLDDELRRFRRITTVGGAAEWLCPMTTVSALVDHVGELCADGTEDIPPTFRELLRRAGAGTDDAAFLHSLAGRLRALDQQPADDYDTLPMARWEIDVRFPHLAGIGANWVYEGDHVSLEEALRAAVASEHPFCSAFLAPLTAEAQSALVLFPEERAMAEVLAPVIGWATPGALHRLLHVAHDHMRREHAGHPWKKGPVPESRPSRSGASGGSKGQARWSKDDQPSPSHLPHTAARGTAGTGVTRVGEYARARAERAVCGLTIGLDNSRHETAPDGTAIPDEGLTT